ncbi:SAGA complex subunit spt20 [Metarhizium anisopliae]
MVTTSPVVQQNGAAKIKRPVPPGIQTNGIASSNSSPSPSMSAKKPPTSAKQAPNSASDRSITASTVRPVNRARRENSSQAAGKPPSLVVHLHATHFRFDGQVGMFPYKSPMGKFIEHLRARTLPHDILEYLIEAKVPFYDGCLIVQIHDHKSLAQTTKAVTKASRTSNAVLPSSIHNYNQCLTPSPYVPFPKEEQVTENGIASKDTDNSKQSPEEEKDKESVTAPTQPPESTTTKEAAKPKIFTAVLHPTPESLQADLKIKATTPKGDGKGVNDTPSLAPPSTPLSLVPPTPTASSMPPPANKRQKKERMELDSSTIYAAEGQILLATTAPLILEPTRNPEETILLLEAMAHPKHSEPPPQPKTRKRTVAEMAADEAAAADQERYMLTVGQYLWSSRIQRY